MSIRTINTSSYFSRSFSILTCTFLALTALEVDADLSNNDKARNAVALGRVASQCGQNSTPAVAVSPMLSLDLASETSGLTYSEVIQMLQADSSQELVQHRVNELEADIKAGRKTCKELLSRIYAGEKR
jgi:hypothetical protein